MVTMVSPRRLASMLVTCIVSLTMAAAFTHLATAALPTADPGGPYTATVGLAVQLDGTGSFDPEGGPLSYDWEFGDGHAGNGAQPTHTYTTAGLYTVTLTVTDPEVLTNSASTTVRALTDDTVLALSPDECITVADTCRSIQVVIHRVTSTGARAASVRFALSSELELCDPAAGVSINQGDWLSGFEPNIFFAVNDNGDGTYTVDQAILGQPCGVTTGGVLFTVDVKKATGVVNATGTITIVDVTVTDCSSGVIATEAGPPASIAIDTTLPSEITGIAARKQLSGNGGNGTASIEITFDEPGSDVDVVEIWRADYGNYPEYDDPPDPGSVPALPSLYPPSLSDPRWELTAVTTSGQLDEPAERGYWYYIAIAKDACGNPGMADEMASALNYHLGDVTPTENPGDNQVNFFDISRLGTCYFAALDPNDPCGDSDVAPVGPDGRPLTDNLVNFQDLLVFATNFELVSATGTPAPIAELRDSEPRVELRTATSDGGDLHATLMLADNPGTLRGFHVVIDLGAAELGTVARGRLLDAQGAEVFFAHQANGRRLIIDAASLGATNALIGDGELVELTLTATGALGPSLVEADLRDLSGQAYGAATAGIAADSGADGAARAATLTLLGARPNPFNPSTEIRFVLAHETQVAIGIYDVSGHLVRSLIEAPLPAGEHGIEWDGRDARGVALGSGVYLYSVRAGQTEIVDKLLMVK